MVTVVAFALFNHCDVIAMFLSIEPPDRTFSGTTMKAGFTIRATSATLNLVKLWVSRVCLQLMWRKGIAAFVTSRNRVEVQMGDRLWLINEMTIYNSACQHLVNVNTN
ncbi:hypothetical protein LSAT2_029565 [Lamellibrachia satsuma]|nr:hypothetical protein LSAT2_029565 [Lamellibrachia satsuma]